jgi:glutathione S-transferase
LDGEKVIGSRRIMARLDELVEEPRLYPADGDARARVEEIDVWGEEVLQALARRLIWWALRKPPASSDSYGEDSHLPIPAFVTRGLLPSIVRIEWRINDVSDASTQRDLAALPGHLDRIDRWIADGLLGGAAPNAADLQIGASIALLRTMADLRPALDGRPVERLARNEFASFPGEIPPVTFPAASMQPAD